MQFVEEQYRESIGIFAGLDEIVEIKHTALSKKVFAQGSIKAAQYILNKENGLYDMNNLINNN